MRNDIQLERAAAEVALTIQLEQQAVREYKPNKHLIITKEEFKAHFTSFGQFSTGWFTCSGIPIWVEQQD